MKNLVIGGAGFIGSNLCDALIDRGDFVVVLDNLLRGKIDNIKHLENNSNFIFVEGDANNESLLLNLISKYKINYIYHLAANSDIQASANDPDIEFECTTKTTWTILSAMRKSNVKKLFFSSTSALYGNHKEKLSEETTSLHPISYYGSAKMASEAFINAFSFMNNFDVLVFRFPNVIGPRLTHGVIFDFINKLLVNPNELTVLGNGHQEKQYIYVSDLISAIVNFSMKNKGLNIYNVGVDSSSNVSFIAEQVVKSMGLNQCKILYGDTDYGWKGDIPKFQFDISKIQNAGWHGHYSSNEAVIMTINQYLESIDFKSKKGN